MSNKYDYWYITGEGKRPGEHILTKYKEDGTIKHVACGWCDGKFYRLYPTKSTWSIKEHIKVSVHFVRLISIEKAK